MKPIIVMTVFLFLLLLAGSLAAFSIIRKNTQEDKNTNIKVVLPSKDLIHVKVPNQDLTSPVVLTGEARGGWYFEGSFPIILLDKDKKEIGRTTAKAQKDWMTEDFVPFTATLTFKQPNGGTGILVFKKDNLPAGRQDPSGLPENDNELPLNVTFPRK